MRFYGYLILILVAIVFLLQLLPFSSYLLPALQDYSNQITRFIESQYWCAVSLYSIIFVLATVTVLPITILLTVAGGYFFGVWYGLLYCMLSMLMGMSLIFFLVRSFFARYVQTRYATQVQFFARELADHGYRYLIAVHLLPITPPFLVSIFAALVPVSYTKFIVTAGIGLLPGTFIYVYAGKELHALTSLHDIFSWHLLFLLSMVAIFLLLPILLSRCKFLK